MPDLILQSVAAIQDDPQDVPQRCMKKSRHEPVFGVPSWHIEGSLHSWKQRLDQALVTHVTCRPM
ncbi:MAG TPA: hypothetical protein V6C52_07625 [Coleofasciculaceae cyanobacterium]|jgi:hypothetical protein